MEVHAPEVAGCIVALVVPFPSLTRFTVGKKGLVWRSVDCHPDLAYLSVDTVGVTSQLMFAAEAVGIVSAEWTFQSQHSASGRFGADRLECRRSIRTRIRRWYRHNGLLGC